MDLTVTSWVYLVGELDPIPQVIQSFERLKKRKKKHWFVAPVLSKIFYAFEKPFIFSRWKTVALVLSYYLPPLILPLPTN